MRILLYNPDNGVTRNFMPHLWMFLLQALTPPGHEVLLVDGNAQPMDETQIAQFVRDQNIGLVGIGAMTRMVARAYRMADAIRVTRVPVVMGGPHAAGRLTRPRHWLDFVPFTMAHTPLKMTIEEAHAELNYGWAHSYSPEALAQAVAALDDQHVGDRFNIFLARLCFRGIYFPMMRKSSWLRVVLENRRTILRLLKEGVFRWARPRNSASQDSFDSPEGRGPAAAGFSPIPKPLRRS